MVKTTGTSDLRAATVGSGALDESAISKAPVVTETARAELLESLKRGEDDSKAGRVERMSVAELKADLRAVFERITGHEVS